VKRSRGAADVPTEARVLLGIASFLFAVLAGCASYEPKPGEPAARLRFVNYGIYPTSFFVQDSAACPERGRLIFQQLSGLFSGAPGRLGMAGAPEAGYSGFTEVHIPANRRVLMVAGSGISSAYGASDRAGDRTVSMMVDECSVGIAFDAKPDSQYEVQFRYRGRDCSVRAYELGGSGERVTVGANSFSADFGTNLCQR
jgi:hypothetical protein